MGPPSQRAAPCGESHRTASPVPAPEANDTFNERSSDGDPLGTCNGGQASEALHYTEPSGDALLRAIRVHNEECATMSTAGTPRSAGHRVDDEDFTVLTDGVIVLRCLRARDARAHLDGEDDEQVRWLSVSGSASIRGTAWP